MTQILILLNIYHVTNIDVGGGGVSSYLDLKFKKRWMVSSSNLCRKISIIHKRLDHKSVQVITESSAGTRRKFCIQHNPTNFSDSILS